MPSSATKPEFVKDEGRRTKDEGRSTTFRRWSFVFRPSLATHLWAFLGYLLLSLVVTYPTVLHFTTQVPGELIADRNQHYWNLWWITEALSRPTNPLHTDMLYYPFGVPLYYHVLGITQWLIGLVPQLLFGYAASYNTVIIAALTLSGYAAFRLALLFTGKPLPSFLGGVVFGFTPYTLGSIIDGQNEVTSIQWIPFYAEAWIRAWHAPTWRARWLPLVLGGVIIALGAYTTLYYPVQILVFTVVHIVYMLVARRDRSETVRRAALSLAIVGVIGLALSAPLVRGLAANYNNPRLEVSARNQMMEHSADLFSFFAFPHDHPILGKTVYGTDKLIVRDNLTLGWVALALAITGAVVTWRRKYTRFWVAFGLVGMVLAMGPDLQIGRTLVGIPLPFKLVAGLPGIEGIGKVERFVALTRCAMAVLAAWGSTRVMDWLRQWIMPDERRKTKDERQTTEARLSSFVLRPSSPAKWLPFAALLALLLAELPLHPRYIQPFNTPAGYSQLANVPPGGLMELPFATQQDQTISDRMVYETVHNHPIMAGYLSRNYRSPIIDSCSALWGFISARYLPIEKQDIITPTVVSRPLDVLNFYGIRYLALYNTYNGPGTQPLDPEDRAAYKDILVHVSHTPAFYSDSFVSLYTVDSANLDSAPVSFHLGDGWHDVEQTAGEPFRWMEGNTATLCVFAPRQVTGSLVMQSTSFGQERQVGVYKAREPGSSPLSQEPAQPGLIADQVYSGTVFANGSYTAIRTQPVTWQPGITQVYVTATGPAIQPRSVDPKLADDRLLTAGFRRVHLESGDQK